MKVTIIGAGAIGGLLGTKLAAAGEAQVSALARGATLAALRERGWRVKQGDALTAAPVAAAHALDDARAGRAASESDGGFCPAASFDPVARFGQVLLQLFE